MSVAYTSFCQRIEVRGCRVLLSVTLQVVGEVFPDDPQDVWFFFGCFGGPE